MSILGQIDNTQVVKLKYNVNMGAMSDKLIWEEFDVTETTFVDKVTSFLFKENCLHKKVLLGKFNYSTNSLPISYISV